MIIEYINDDKLREWVLSQPIKLEMAQDLFPIIDSQGEEEEWRYFIRVVDDIDSKISGKQITASFVTEGLLLEWIMNHQRNLEGKIQSMAQNKKDEA